MKITSLIALFLALSLSFACQTSRPGVKNTLGTYSAHIDAAPASVTRATEAALQGLDLNITMVEATQLDGRVEARNANEKKVVVRSDLAGDNVSKVRIKVGSGDEALSLKILDDIRARL